MKVIDAFWEKRNLNVDVTEVELDKRDMLDVHSTISKIAELRSPGRVIYIKIPVGNLNLLHALEDIGFRFLECQIKVSRSLNDYEPPADLKPLLENTSVQIIKKDKDGLRLLLEKISPGMFATDRICLDPLWGGACEEISATRYKNWITDIFQDNTTTCYYFLKSSKIVGFGVANQDSDGDVVHGLLGGVLKSEIDPVASVCFLHAPLLLFKGLKTKFITSISSNNFAVCRLYIFFGYKIEKMQYVMRCFS